MVSKKWEGYYGIRKNEMNWIVLVINDWLMRFNYWFVFGSLRIIIENIF